MRYFALTFRDATRAIEEVWSLQDQADKPHTSFHVSAEGQRASVWTADAGGMGLFRHTLERLGVAFEEGAEQQVVTFLDRIFGDNAA